MSKNNFIFTHEPFWIDLSASGAVHTGKERGRVDNGTDKQLDN
jgi:hypothetical protein